jgi:hypothetical protein
MIITRRRWRLFCLLMAPAWAYEEILMALLGIDKKVTVKLPEEEEFGA